MIPSPVERLRDARDVVRAAEKQLVRVLRSEFPVGAEVSWKRGRTVSHGVVHGHGYFDTLWARNTRTEAIVKISAHDILEAAI